MDELKPILQEQPLGDHLLSQPLQLPADSVSSALQNPGIEPEVLLEAPVDLAIQQPTDATSLTEPTFIEAPTDAALVAAVPSEPGPTAWQRVGRELVSGI